MRTNDGLELTCTTPEDIVRELHKSSRSPCATDAEFMRAMAGRVALTTGKRISARSPEEFVRRLVVVGVLLEE